MSLIERLFSDPEMVEIQARMTLAGQTLGGLVSQEKLPEAYVKQRTRDNEARGHNWELLRQKAESDGLYFQPIGLEPFANARPGLDRRRRPEKPASAHYDGQFLGFASPYADDRLTNWTGYPHGARWPGHDSPGALQPGVSESSSAGRRFSRFARA